MPPDPAPSADRDSRPDMPGMARKTNWTKVGALATAASALIAFLAYTIPPNASTPNPFPAPESSREPRPYPAPPQEQGSTPGATSPGSAFPVPTLAQPDGAAASCQQAEAAITTYNETVGPTWYSRFDAATRTGNRLDMAYGSGASGVVSSDVSALIQDFTFLQQHALVQDGSGYDAVAAQTNVDIQVLKTDCSTG